MRDYLKLIRLPNLLCVVLSQALVYFMMVSPIVSDSGFYLKMPFWIIASIMMATMFIAAGGYVVNDYFDLKIDRMNRPDKVVVTNSISKKDAMQMYIIFTVAGVGIGLAAAIALKSFTIAFIFIIVAGLMWFYSSSYKRMLIVGNLMVALMAALVPLLPAFAAKEKLVSTFGEIVLNVPVVANIYTMCCGIAFFVFILTVITEILKDINDQYGDREMECHTIPVVWGDLAAKIIVSALSVIFIGLTVAASHLMPFFHNLYTFRFVMTFLLVPLIFMNYYIWSNSCRGIKNSIYMARVTMIFLALYPILFYFMLTRC